ncbi:MAG: SUMF1/EgtB/PvdO family nonheme iron enzyme [Thermoguttaceae bacterium]|jgi:formylglycine-generating enzyme required for sulfatase activity
MGIFCCLRTAMFRPAARPSSASVLWALACPPGQLLGLALLLPLACTVAWGEEEAAPRTINLIPYVDPQQDALTGEWKRVFFDRIALAMTDKPSVLQLPYEPPNEYDFLVEFTMLGGGDDVVQCVDAGGRSFAWKMGRRHHPPLYCFDLLDGKTVDQNSETASPRSETLEIGKRHTSLIEVRQGGLRALVDGEEYVKWSGDFRRLSMEPAWTLRDDHRLGIGCARHSVVFYRVEVREVRGAGKLTRTRADAKVQVVPTTVEVTNSIGMKLTQIPAGEFLMGASDGFIAYVAKGCREEMESAAREANSAGDHMEWERQHHEKPEVSLKRATDRLERAESMGPRHRVIITKPFLLGTCPVTQREFSAVMGYHKSEFSATGKKKERVAGIDTSRCPVENVSWEEATEYCRQLSAMPEEVAAGRTYRLPTEAEWEYACRAGTTTPLFWDNMGTWDEFAWLAPNSDGRPHPVGEKLPNPWGLYDIVSNVKEWCADWYDPKAYAASPLRDPMGPASGIRRILRGAVFAQPLALLRCEERNTALPGSSWWETGLRVACDVSGAAPQFVQPALPAETPSRSRPATDSQGPDVQLAKKGLLRRMGFFVLADESAFIRYTTTVDRLRVACFNAKRECIDAQGQLDRAKLVQSDVLRARMRARAHMSYSEDWREYHYAERARNSATDALMIVDLSKEDLGKWKKDADADFHRAVDAFGGQCQKLRQMLDTLRDQYVKLAKDAEVQHALAEVNNTGKAQYRLGPSPSAIAAAKRLQHEEELHQQFKAK